MKSLLRSAVRAVMGAVVVLAMSTTTAFAGQGYGAVAGESTGGSGGGGGSLPFTGADIALYAVIGGVVAGSGLALRRYGARRRTS